MTKNLLTFLSIFILGCSTTEQPIIIGSWLDCQRDGTYRETKITSNYLAAIWSTEDSLTLDQIRVFRSNIQDSLLILTSGIGFDLLNAPDTYKIRVINPNLVELSNKFGAFELQRTVDEIQNIDSANYERWGLEFINNFLVRAELTECPDLRTEEEKNLIDLGTVNDDFEDIIDIPYDPELDGPKDTLSNKH